MRGTWIRLAFLAPVAGAVLIAWLAAGGDTTVPVIIPAPDLPYAIATNGNVSWDLDFDPASDYLLIVGSLGDSAQEHSFEVTSRPVPRLAVTPLTEWRLPPRTTPPKTTPTDATPAATAGPTPTQAAPPERLFHLHVGDGSLEDRRAYVEVRGKLVAAGSRVAIYLDGQQTTAESAPGLAEETLALLEREVLPAIEAQLGPIRDIDGDQRFTVLLTHWLGRLQGGKTSVGGFVRSSDFREGLATPFSNRCDMLYLNTQLVPGLSLRTLLMHELTHAAAISRRLPAPGRPLGLADEEDWLNEGLAHLVESAADGSWTNLDYRISGFLNEPHRYPLVIADYYRAGLWREHGCRGSTFLFLRWCADRTGSELPRRLAESPATGVRNIETATSLGFDDLFRGWSVALWTDGLPAGRSAGGFETLDLRGATGRYGLAGPRADQWEVDQGPRTFTVRGTAVRFVEIHGGVKPGPQRITLQSAPEARLQLTLIRRSPTSPRPVLTATWKPGVERTAQISMTGLITIERIICERQGGDKQQVSILPVESPNAAGIYTVPLAPSADRVLEETPWTIKAVGRDAAGRPVTAWIDLAPVTQTASR